MNNKEFINKYKSEEVYYRPLQDNEEIVHKIPKLKSEYNWETYTINDACLIGITGSYAKSSTAYLVHKYLKYLGYRSCLISSMSIDIPGSGYDITTGFSGYITTKEELADLLYQCEQYQAEFIVFEVNENAICNNIIDELTFSEKVLTSFIKSSNKHMDGDHYLNTKLSFFDETPAVLNAASEYIVDFTTKSTGDKFLFHMDSDNIISSENSKELISNLGIDIKLYPEFKLASIDNSYMEVNLNGNVESIETTLSMNTGLNMLICAMAVISHLNELEMTSFKKFAKELANVPGRCEDFQWIGRTFMFDSGNDDFLERIYNELNSEALKNAKAKYVEKFGTAFKTQEINRITGIFNVIGGINDYVLKQLYRDSNFKFLNPSSDSDPTTRKHFLIFGGNMHKLVHKLKEFRDDANFNEMVEEVGKDVFLDFSNNNDFSAEYLEDLYARIISYSMMALGLKEDMYKFMKNFACRSICGLKAFFGTHPKDFELLYNYFKSLNFQPLSDACDYISGLIERTEARYVQHCKVVNSLNLDKLYITMDNSNDTGSEYELERTVKNIKNQNYETFGYRLDALKRLVNDSQEGDLILVCGRGDRREYTNNENGTSLNVSDREYIERYCSLL